MANSIALFKKYIDLFDEVYKASAKTSVLDIDGRLVQAGANANEIIIPKISTEGLADYSRNGGYVSRNTTFTNETVTFNYDRGGKFSVDAMDNEETEGLAFGSLAADFVRTKTVPELDAFRFATYAAEPMISSASGNLASGEAVLAALVNAQNTLDEDEVSSEGRYFFITPTLYNLAQNVDTYKSKSMMEKFTGVIDVPQSRFYTAVDLYDGTSPNEKSGGYVKDAVIQFSKHTVNKIFTPEENQNSDGYIFCYRAYGLTDAYENKAARIYLHASTT